MFVEEMRRNVDAEDLTGQRFDRLTAIKPTEERCGGEVVWECQCDCGETVFVPIVSLVSGRAKSCGCLKKRRQGSEKIVVPETSDENGKGYIGDDDLDFSGLKDIGENDNDELNGTFSGGRFLGFNKMES